MLAGRAFGRSSVARQHGAARIAHAVRSPGSGAHGVVAGENETVLLPGDEAVIPADESYRRGNAGDEEAQPRRGVPPGAHRHAPPRPRSFPSSGSRPPPRSSTGSAVHEHPARRRTHTRTLRTRTVRSQPLRELRVDNAEYSRTHERGTRTAYPPEPAHRHRRASRGGMECGRAARMWLARRAQRPRSGTWRPTSTARVRQAARRYPGRGDG
jgi:hypothetical protein